MDFAGDVLAFPWRWNPQMLHDCLLRARDPPISQDHAGVLGGRSPPAKLALRVTTLLLNGHTAIIGMPGEPFVEFQVGWRNGCPVRSCFSLVYTNGPYDYFPTILAASQGGHCAGDSDTCVEVGAGERMLDRSLVRVHEMLGEAVQVPLPTPRGPPCEAGARPHATDIRSAAVRPPHLRRRRSGLISNSPPHDCLARTFRRRTPVAQARPGG